MVVKSNPILSALTNSNEQYWKKSKEQENDGGLIHQHYRLISISYLLKTTIMLLLIFFLFRTQEHSLYSVVQWFITLGYGPI